MKLIIDISEKDYLECVKRVEEIREKGYMIENLKYKIIITDGIPLEEGLRMNIQWIPTSERQPEHTGDYLVTMGINYDGVGMSDYVRVASYNIYFGWGLYEKNDIHTLFGEITAWAELPKIYNPEKDRE